MERNTPPIMAGEDFSYMLEERPGAYIQLGNGGGATVHHPEYNFNDEAIPAGCSWFAEVVERLRNSQANLEAELKCRRLNAPILRSVAQSAEACSKE